MASETYLVTLATGRQGRATATELLNHGKAVHALVRDKTTEPAQSLAALGCSLFEYNPSSPSTSDPDILTAAMSNCVGIFLNIFPSPPPPPLRSSPSTSSDLANPTDLLAIRTLLSAARASHTIRKIVLSTALNTPSHPIWLAANPAYPLASYFGTKFAIEAELRAATLQDPDWEVSYTILRPAFLMHNYLAPLCVSHFPRYYDYTLDVAYGPDVRTAHLDAWDVGAFAMAALLDRKVGRFDGVEIELANQELTIEEVAGVLGEVVLGPGRAFEVDYLKEEEVRRLSSRSPALGIRLWGEEEGAFRVRRGDDGKPIGGDLVDRFGIAMGDLREFSWREKWALGDAIEYAKARKGLDYGEQQEEIMEEGVPAYDIEDWEIQDMEAPNDKDTWSVD